MRLAAFTLSVTGSLLALAAGSQAAVIQLASPASLSPGDATLIYPGTVGSAVASPASFSAGSNTFILPGAGQGFDAIAGFTETNGDVLNLHAALQETNWNGKANTLSNYVKVTDVGNNTDISIANNGTGGGVLVAQLTNTPRLGFADLVSHHSIQT